MRVKRAKFDGFRGLVALDLDLAGRTTVLVGKNGTGKSAVLDGLAALLSPLPDHLQREVGGSQKRTSRPLWAEDVTNWLDRTSIALEVEHQGQTYAWTRTAERTLRGRTKELRSSDEERGPGALVKKWLPAETEKWKTAAIPMAVFYPTNRAVLDVPYRIRTRHKFDQVDAWSLQAGESQFRLFFEWFRDKEDLENQIRLRSKAKHRDRELEAVRRAISILVPGLDDLRVERAPLRMVVTKEKRDVEVSQLSDGEKCLLAMVADLARRLTLANPAGVNPLEGEGIVLIDEIELHLHPAWQRTVVADLSRTFPGCQFIISTHSPQVLGDVRPEDVHVLQSGRGGVEAIRPGASFGRDSNRILEDLMGVPDRRQETKAQLAMLFKLIDAGRLEEARELRSRLAASIGRSWRYTRGDVGSRRTSAGAR